MRFPARFSLLAVLLVGAVLAISASAAQAEFGIVPGSFQSGVCTSPTPCPVPDTQAGSHPAIGFTTFTFNTTGGVPDGTAKDVRVDVPAGLITNPQAVPTCPDAQLLTSTCPANSQIGLELLTVEIGAGAHAEVELPIYNMVPPSGAPADFAFLTATGRVDIVGGVSWESDYHESFSIHAISPLTPLVKVVQIFFGAPEFVTSGHTVLGNAFLTVPTSCLGPTTTRLETDSYQSPGQFKQYAFTPPLQTTGCNLVPFAPSIAVNPETTQSDVPDGATVEVKVPVDQNPTHLASSHLHISSVVLPEGLTINPSAAHGLEGCTEAQLGVGTTNAATCPEAAKIGTVAVETPLLPPGSLVGSIYLGRPASGPITGPPYTIFLNAESPRYGSGLRLVGSVVPNEATGRLTAVFNENPQNPFSSLTLHFTGPPLGPLANPLSCGAAETTAALTPWSGQPPALLNSAFTVDANGNGGACAAPLPFALSASSQLAPASAGSKSSYTLNLARADGQQYLSHVSATLPPGLVGLIPSVPLCGEPQAAQGACPFASQIGTATVSVGAGATPIQFSGPAALTGPYNGAPYGMSVAVAATAGPFSLGTVVVRAALNINPFTARVNVSASLPTIVKGIPLRLRNLSVAINRQGFLINPTNCGALATEATLGSTFGASQSLSTPFQVSGCGSLAFKPRLTASSNAKTSKKNGASLGVKIGYPSGAQANIKSVFVTLPKQLPARLSTLQKACPEATFNANPFACPSGSRVGGATVTTPVLPSKLTGPAFFVSHGGAAFPDLDLVLAGGGVEVILVGNTNIKGSITTSTFAAVPDVPVSGFELNLPVGPNSAFAANGNLCSQPLTMPTTITAQSGTVLKQSTKIVVSGCGVKVGSHTTSGHTAVLKVKAPAAGRVSGSASNLQTTYRHTARAQTITLKVPLSSAGVRALHRNHTLKVKVRVGFIPKAKGPTSVTYATVTFRG
ncbi:MAG TPA: hypothetical protein VID29_05885 [Solirubrobacteraceae bacterium]|jgi:hypothetical protein